MPNLQKESSPKNDDEMRVPQKNALEWLVFAASLILVFGTLGYLIFTAVTYEKSPPILSIQLGKTQPLASQFRVPVVVSNEGNQTATGVQIEVTLNEGQPNEEKSNFTAPYLPRHSQRDGAVLFKSDPRQGKLQSRILGYENP